MVDPILPHKVYPLDQALGLMGMSADELTELLASANLQIVDTGKHRLVLGETLLQAFKIAAGHISLEIQPKAVYTLEAVACLLHVSPDTVQRLAQNGSLRISPVGRKKVVLGEELLRFLREANPKGNSDL